MTAVASPDSAFEIVGARRLELLAQAIARAADARAYYEPSHSDAVARIAAAMGSTLALSPRHIDRLRLAAALHDVGKLGVPDAILLKREPLNPVEWEWIKNHSRIGRDIVDAAGLDEEATWILHVHERLDGSGYPHGLLETEIPFESRVIAVADAFDVLTSARSYKTAIPEAQALIELERSTGSHLDGACVDALRRALVATP